MSAPLLGDEDGDGGEDDGDGDTDADGGDDDEEEEDLLGMVIMLSLQGACGLLHVHLCSQPW